MRLHCARESLEKIGSIGSVSEAGEPDESFLSTQLCFVQGSSRWASAGSRNPLTSPARRKLSLEAPSIPVLLTPLKDDREKT
jgi:hypothetical protein